MKTTASTSTQERGDDVSAIETVDESLHETTHTRETRWRQLTYIVLAITAVVVVVLTVGVFWRTLKWWIVIATIAAGFVALWSIPFVVVRLVVATLDTAK